MAVQDLQTKFTLGDGREVWLLRAEDAPDCGRCETEMMEQDTEPAGGTPTSPMFRVLFRCPDCGHGKRTSRRR